MEQFKCPKHKANLHTVEDYEGALVHNGCPEIFTVIDGNLCILDGNQWRDTKTDEIREVKEKG